MPNPGTSAPFTFETWFRARSSGGIFGQTSQLNGSGVPQDGFVPLVYVRQDGRLHVQIVWPGAPAMPLVSDAIVIDKVMPR